MVLYHSNGKVAKAQRSRNVTWTQGETVLCLALHKGPGFDMSKGTHMDSKEGGC